MQIIPITIFLLVSLITTTNVDNLRSEFVCYDSLGSFLRAMEDKRIDSIIQRSEQELKELGIKEYTMSEGYKIIGVSFNFVKPRTEKEINADFSRNRKFFMRGDSKESYAKYVNQVEECEKYARIIYRFLEIYEENDPIIELESVHHTDNGYTVFHFAEVSVDDAYLSFIYDKDGKCIGYVHSGFIKF